MNAVRQYVSSQFYAYPVNPQPLVCSTAAPTPAGNINFDTASDFEAQYILVAADIAAAAQTDSTRVIPLATIMITNSGGNNWFESPVPLSLLMGDGRLPFILPEPLIVPSNSNVSFTLARYAAAVDYNIRIVLGGRKLFFA